MVTEKRLIDADARIEEIKKANCTNCDNYNGIKCRACWVDDAIGLIDDAPTVDAVKHGRWIDKATCYVCSLCGRVERLREPYCHCGAKMDGGG